MNGGLKSQNVSDTTQIRNVCLLDKYSERRFKLQQCQSSLLLIACNWQ